MTATIPAPARTNNKLSGTFYPLQRNELIALRKSRLINNAAYVYLALRVSNPSSDPSIRFVIKDFALCWHIPESSLYEAISKLKKLNLLPEWLDYESRQNNLIEAKVRDRLHQKLGGLIEVTTPSGRIDLLTDTEIIEVKRFADWKAALGQILVYSAFYPEHQKRIHLFGRRDELTKIADVYSACLNFDVVVTAEEV